MTTEKSDDGVITTTITYPDLPKANLSPTNNPTIYLDRQTGELYFFDAYNVVHSDNCLISEIVPALIKLNDKRE